MYKNVILDTYLSGFTEFDQLFLAQNFGGRYKEAEITRGGIIMEEMGIAQDVMGREELIGRNR